MVCDGADDMQKMWPLLRDHGERGASSLPTDPTDDESESYWRFRTGALGVLVVTTVAVRSTSTFAVNALAATPS